MNGDGGGGKLATALIVILVLSLFLFFAQLFYVLWRRRIFHRQTYAAGGGGGIGRQGDDGSHYSSSVSNFTTASSSKELLYFLSLRSPDFRLDANSATACSNSTTMSDLNSDRLSDFEAIDIDLLKLYGKFTPPRNLFTIKEGQKKQAATLPAGKSEAKMEAEIADQYGTGACPENSAAVEAEEEAEAAKKEEIENGGSVDVITPFSTPCGSPLYLTPTASPVHEKSDCRSS